MESCTKAVGKMNFVSLDIMYACVEKGRVRNMERSKIFDPFLKFYFGRLLAINDNICEILLQREGCVNSKVWY